ncbi:hypothetical protein T05_14499 [Trichinella murrelli]|uniref:Uncharacterized protein n=1 Tax=Trichinella murrelli TaxID=144512 RepID=A0A0V0TTT2_9BILA|nr:hypothetical protein T05_14499 [Trichinella murrelli]
MCHKVMMLLINMNRQFETAGLIDNNYDTTVQFDYVHVERAVDTFYGQNEKGIGCSWRDEGRVRSWLVEMKKSGNTFTGSMHACIGQSEKRTKAANFLSRRRYAIDRSSFSSSRNMPWLCNAGRSCRFYYSFILALLNLTFLL